MLHVTGKQEAEVQGWFRELTASELRDIPLTQKSLKISRYTGYRLGLRKVFQQLFEKCNISNKDESDNGKYIYK